MKKLSLMILLPCLVGLAVMAQTSETNEDLRIIPSAGGYDGVKAVELQSALDLYGHLKERTVLQPSTSKMPGGHFAWHSTSTNKAETITALEKAFRERGLTIIPDGDKFVMVVPTALTNVANPHAPKTDPSSATKPPEANAQNDLLIPAGEIRLPGIDAVAVMEVYAELVGRKWIKEGWQVPNSAGVVHSPNTSAIYLVTQTPVTKSEAAYAMETLFAWENIRIVPEDANAFKAIWPDSK